MDRPIRRLESNHAWSCEGYYKKPGTPRRLRVAPNCPGTSQTRTTTLSTANSTAKEPGGRERAKFAKRLPCSKLPRHTTYGGRRTLDRLFCASSKHLILRISSRRTTGSRITSGTGNHSHGPHHHPTDNPSNDGHGWSFFFHFFLQRGGESRFCRACIHMHGQHLI